MEEEDDNLSNTLIWGNSNGHHTIEGEVQEGEIHDEQVPKELGSCPFKSNHSIDNDTIGNRLHKDIRDFNENLQEKFFYR